MKRTLRLRRESLADLTPAELGGVAGGQEISLLSCPLLRCLPTVRDCFDIDPSILTDPPTFPPTCYTFPWC